MTETHTSLIAAGFLIGSIAAWTLLVRRREPGGAIIPYEPRLPVPWDLPVIAPVVLMFLGFRIGFLFLARLVVAADGELEARLSSLSDPQLQWAEPDFARPMFQAAALSQIFTAVAVAILLTKAYRATVDDLGLPVRRIAYDLRLGFVGFFAFSAPAVLLQGILTLVSESQHPIVLSFKNTADWSAFFWATFAAVLVAPVVEEFLFRGVLQGLFERIWAERNALPPPNDLDSPPDAAVERPSAAPIFISATIFALMHWSSGIDVVPLFLLALGLGYLYRQTHRLWPCIVVHMLLNAFSMGTLLLQTK